MRRTIICQGCEETRATKRLPEIGAVCDSCFEIPDIVYEVVLERVQEANRKMSALLEEWES